MSYSQHSDHIHLANIATCDTLCLKNTPTLVSCSFKKHRLILIIFGKNDTRVQLSLSLHLYFLYLLSNSCDRNDAFWHHSKLVKQSSSFIRKHRTLSLQICARQTVRLTTELVDWCRNVCTLYIVQTLNICPWHQPLWPATWSSASLSHGQAYHKTSSTKQLVNAEIGYMQAWGIRTSLCVNICYNWNLLFSEPAHYTTGSFQSHQQSTKENMLFGILSIAAI